MMLTLKKKELEFKFWYRGVFNLNIQKQKKNCMIFAQGNFHSFRFFYAFVCIECIGMPVSRIYFQHLQNLYMYELLFSAFHVSEFIRCDFTGGISFTILDYFFWMKLAYSNSYKQTTEPINLHMQLFVSLILVYEQFTIEIFHRVSESHIMKMKSVEF